MGIVSTIKAKILNEVRMPANYAMTVTFIIYIIPVSTLSPAPLNWIVTAISWKLLCIRATDCQRDFSSLKIWPWFDHGYFVTNDVNIKSFILYFIYNYIIIIKNQFKYSNEWQILTKGSKCVNDDGSVNVDGQTNWGSNLPNADPINELKCVSVTWANRHSKDG
jgi:hypothetical protein